MLTAAGRAFLLAGLALAGLGAAFGNSAWLAAAAFPALLAVGAAAAAPRGLAARVEPSTRAPRRGDVVRLAVEVELPRGTGHVEAWIRLPDEVELVEGTNLRVLPLARKPRTERWELAFRATKRGPMEIPPARLEWHDPLGLALPRAADGGEPLAIDVLPRLPHLRRVAPVKSPAARLVPEGDPAPIGPPGTDFRDIREYAWGDPPKSINWKATARRLSRGEDAVPLVNEYQREGKKNVWIFLDASGAMEVGTSLETALEHALEAAGSVATHYLDRGYAVGFTAWNARSRDVLYPDHGRRQLRRILRHVAALEPAPEGDADGLAAAVDRSRRWFRGAKPMAVVLTRLAEPADDTLAGLDRLAAALRQGRRSRSPLFVVDTRPWTRLEDDEVPAVLDALDAPLAAEARSRGARVIPWRPGRERFEAAFLAGLGRGRGPARAAPPAVRDEPEVTA